MAGSELRDPNSGTRTIPARTKFGRFSLTLFDLAAAPMRNQRR